MNDEHRWKLREGSLQGKRAKLTPQQRHEIRQRRSDGQRAIDLALEYGVTRSYVDYLGRL